MWGFWGLKRPQKTSNVSIFWDRSKVNRYFQNNEVQKGHNWGFFLFYELTKALRKNMNLTKKKNQKKNQFVICYFLLLMFCSLVHLCEFLELTHTSFGRIWLEQPTQCGAGNVLCSNRKCIFYGTNCIVLSMTSILYTFVFHYICPRDTRYACYPGGGHSGKNLC